jgi:5-methylcytosine-specific restriction enzyme subunit McrC
LVQLLLEGVGPALGEASDPIELPGFLFDMNRFFQALISRLLNSELDNVSVRDERTLGNLFEYDPSRNPRLRRSHAPRPDFSVMSKGKVIALLDAKYRDLWENHLPAHMLYQLAIYALSQEEAGARAIILYPCTDRGATDQALHFKDPIRRQTRAEVILRPVNLLQLADIVRVDSSQFRQRRRSFADALLSGTPAPTGQMITKI